MGAPARQADLPLDLPLICPFRKIQALDRP
jgi:hypothetical protein